MSHVESEPAQRWIVPVGEEQTTALFVAAEEPLGESVVVLGHGASTHMEHRTMVNLARRLHVEPEFALRHTNQKFRRRFTAMEAASPRPLETMSAPELEALWTQAKEQESPPPAP